jgi:hypothetical protein
MPISLDGSLGIYSSGNITSEQYYFGNGRFLTGINGSGGNGSAIFSGNSSVSFDSNGNAIININGANVASFTPNGLTVANGNVVAEGFFFANGDPVVTDLGNITTNLIPSLDLTYTLGNSTNQWKDLWVGGNTIYMYQIPINLSAVAFANGAVGNTLAVGGNPLVAANTDANLGNLTVSGNTRSGSFASDNYLWANNVPFITSDGNLAIGNINATGNVAAGGRLSGATAAIIGNIAAGGNVNAVGNVNAGNVVATGNVDAAAVSANTVAALTVRTGNVIATDIYANTITSNTANIVGTMTAGNIATPGSVIATGNIQGGNVVAVNTIQGTNIVASGNVNTDLVVGNQVTIQSTGAGQGINLVPGANGNVNVNSTYINNVLSPQQATDAANKSYVDSVASGVRPTLSVVLTSTATLNAYTYNNGTAGVGATITLNTPAPLFLEGQTVTAGMRVLIKDEVGANAPYNGIYVCTTQGTPSVAAVLTRATDFDLSTEVPSTYTFAEYSNAGFVCITPDTPTPVIGTTDIIWTQFSEAGAYQAGQGMTLTSQVFNVNPDNDTIYVNGSNKIAIKPGANLPNVNIQSANIGNLAVTGNTTVANITASGTTTTNNLVSNNTTTTGNTTSGNLITTGTTYSNAIVGNSTVTNGNTTTTGTTISGNTITIGSTTTNVMNATTTVTTGNTTSGNVISLGNTTTLGTTITNGLVTNTATISGTLGANTIVANTSTTTGNSTSGNVVSLGNTTTLGTTTTNAIVSNTSTTVGNSTSGNVISLGTTTTNALVSNTTTTTGNTTSGNVISLGNTTTAGTTTTNAIVSNTSTTTGNSTSGNVVSLGNTTTLGTTTTNAIVSNTSTTTGNSTSGNVISNGTVSSATLSTTGNANIGGNLTSANFSTAGNANIGNLYVPGTTTLIGNATAGNLALTAIYTDGYFFANGVPFVSGGGNYDDANVEALLASGNITGNIITTGNISGNYILGNGAFLTGIAPGYTDANVITLLASGNLTSNIITTGNTTSGNSTVTGILTANTANVTGTLTANTATVTGNLTSANVITGNISAGNGVFTGNVTAANFFGNGSALTGMYGNANVEMLLENGIANNIITTGNITANVYFGNGSQLTGMYGNANVSDYLASGNNTANIITTANIQGANIVTIGSVIAGADVSANNVNATAQVTAAGNITGGNITTAGLANVGNLLVTSTSNLVGNTQASNLSASGVVVAVGNVQGGNLLTSGNAIVTGNVEAGNVNTDRIYGPSVTIVATTAGGIVFQSAGNINAGNVLIRNAVDPVAAQDVATKNYVDAVAQGLKTKEAVVAATTTVLPAYVYNNGTGNGIGATITASSNGVIDIDGTGNIITANDRVLVKNETAANAIVNGVYVATDIGNVSAPFVLTRAVDMDFGTEFPSAFVYVTSGNVNQSSGWTCTNTDTPPPDIGVTAITFSQFSYAGGYTAGNGIVLTGTQFSVDPDPETMWINGSNQLGVKPNANLTTPNIGNATFQSLTVLAGGTGNITANNIAISGVAEVIGNVIAGNIETAQVVANANITTLQNVIASGNVNADNVNATAVIATGNVTGGNLIALETVYTVDAIATGNVTAGNLLVNNDLVTTGNITANNLVAANTVTATTANITGNLTVAYIDAANAITASDITLSGNVITANLVATTANLTDITANTIVVESSSDLGNVGNVFIYGGNIGDAIITDGAGNLRWGPAQIIAVPSVYFTATVAGNNQTFSNVILAAYNDAADINLFYNGALLENTFYTLTGDVIQVNTDLEIGDTIDIARQAAGNVTNIISAYGNSNVQSLLSDGITTDINTSGNIQASYYLGNGALLTGIQTTINSIPAVEFTAVANGNSQSFSNVVLGGYTTNTEMTVFKNGVLIGSDYYTLAGDVLTINTYLTVGDNINIITQVASNVVTVISGYGDSNVAAFLTTNTGNISAGYYTGDGSLLTNLPTSNYGNSNVTTLLSSGTVSSNVITTGNISGSYVLGNGSQLTGLPAGYANANVTTLLASGTVSSNVITTGNVSGAYIIGDGSQLTNLPAGNYSNTNVEAFLNGGVFTGDFVPAGDATQSLGSTTNQWKDLWLSGNTLYMTQVPISLTGNTLQVDGANVVTSDANGNITTTGNVNAGGMTITGNAIITGNADVQGTLTYNNITNLTTSNLILGLGNNQSGISVTGGGIVVGSTAEAQWTYDQPNQTWDSNLGIAAAGNITAPYFIGNGSQLTGIVASYGNANVAAYLPTYTGNLAANNATFKGTVVANGNTNGTAFAVVGNGAVSNVALGFFPTGNTAAEMAIRDHSTVASTIYFDASAGGSANGTFNFRTSNAFTSYASLSNTGLTVNSTQTSNTNVNSTIYYNTSNSRFTAGPSMAAFAGVSAPFTGSMSTAQMGYWTQAQGNIVLPQYTTVPTGTTFTFTNSAGSSTSPLRVSVFNSGSDFIYYPPQYGNTTRYVDLYFGQWMTVISRGTGEWDVIASNIQETFKVAVTPTTAFDTGVSLDQLNVRVNSSNRQLAFSAISGSIAIKGSVVSNSFGDAIVQETINTTVTAGTWTQVTSIRAMDNDGDTFVAYVMDVTNNRMYQVTAIRNSGGSAGISIQRTFG